MGKERPESECGDEETVIAPALNRTSNAQPVGSHFIDWTGDPSVSYWGHLDGLMYLASSLPHLQFKFLIFL
jgi:hypothetical protein